MNRKHVIITLSTLCFFISACVPAVDRQAGKTTQQEDSEFLKAVEPYLAEGENIAEIGTEPPEPGYLSGLEVLKRTAYYFYNEGAFNLSYSILVDDEVKTFDQSWITEARFHIPILVYNFGNTADRPLGYDYYYFLHASHPIMGNVYSILFQYNENTNNTIGIARRNGYLLGNEQASLNHAIWDPAKNHTSHVITKKEAIAFYSEIVGKPLRADPVAICMPFEQTGNEQFFQWYFETAARTAGQNEAYIMDSNITIQSKEQLTDIQAYLKSVNASYRSSSAPGSVTSLPTLIAKLSRPLGIYDALDERARSATTKSMHEIVRKRVILDTELTAVLK